MAGQQPDEFPFSSTTGKVPNANFFCSINRQHVADELLGRDLDWLLDQSVDVIFHAADFGKLLRSGML